MSTLMEMPLLSSRMRIAFRPEKLERFSQKHVGFYMKYASFVLRTLRRSSFQKFLRWMLTKENIEEQMVREVQVRVLPFRRKNGNGLAGNCNTDIGKIQIYPRTLKFCRKLWQESGKDRFVSYVKSRARAALIHELLHLKYADDEEKVRELTRGYFAFFTHNRPTQDSHIPIVCDMIFKPAMIENALTSNRRALVKTNSAPPQHLAINAYCLS